jgi:hypothetical protein
MTAPPAWPRLYQLAADAGLEIAGPRPHNAAAHEIDIRRGPDLLLLARAYGSDRDATLRRVAADTIASEAARVTARRLRAAAEQRTAPIVTLAAPPPVLHEESGSIDLGDQPALTRAAATDWRDGLIDAVLAGRELNNPKE